jgi:FKBP-type peptidyl-prolyl cis-trans isomerase FklB
MEALQRKKSEEMYKENKLSGELFLKENAKKAGVVTTASGLQYEVIKEGNGAKPVATDKVKVHYHGTFVNGEKFDSSVERNEPAEFVLNEVIKGWTEGVQLMSVGSKYKFYVPQELAYGNQERGNIKPYSTLIFEVELLGIVK